MSQIPESKVEIKQTVTIQKILGNYIIGVEITDGEIKRSKLHAKQSDHMPGGQIAGAFIRSLDDAVNLRDLLTAMIDTMGAYLDE